MRPTGEQGSGILKSMSEANCFIILGDAVGDVEPGTTVEVQLLEGSFDRQGTCLAIPRARKG